MTKEARALTRADTLFTECTSLECVEKVKESLLTEYTVNQVNDEIIEYMLSKAEQRYKELKE